MGSLAVILVASHIALLPEFVIESLCQHGSIDQYLTCQAGRLDRWTDEMNDDNIRTARTGNRGPNLTKAGASAPDRAWKDNSSSNSFPNLKTLMCHDYVFLTQTEVINGSILDHTILLACPVKI